MINIETWNVWNVFRQGEATELGNKGLKESDSKRGILKKNNKVAPQPVSFAEEVQQRKTNMEF